MAHIVEDRVAETTTSTGTGNIALAGAITGFVDFDSVMANGDTCHYMIEAIDANGIPTGEWETGLGTFNDTDTLVRTSVSRSSNSNAAVNFSAGTKRVVLSATMGATTHRGCLVNNSGSLTIDASSFIYVPWADEVYDTDNIHGISSAVTMTIASPCVVTWTSHGLNAEEPVVFSTTGALPTGVTAGTTYMVKSPTANTFQLAATTGGAAINTSGSQSGTHTATNNSRLTVPAGARKVRLGVCITGSNITAGADVYVGLRKNGSDIAAGGIWFAADAAAQGYRTTAHSAALAVSPGDYFEITYVTSADTSTTLDTLSWFEMEIIN